MADDEVTPLTTTTTNYGWVKPDVYGSDDVWGGYLNVDLDGIDTIVKAVSNAIPLASSTTPVMDGTATIGAGTTFARADHIHPTDTSRYAASNPLGYQTAAQVTTAITTYPVGDNRIVNGNFAINQRGYVSGTALAAAAYGHDRWKAGTAGCTYTFTAAAPDTTITITAGTFTQIIEAGMIEGGVYTLSWTGTAQARVYQGTPIGAYAASPVVTASLVAGTNTIVEFSAGTMTRVKLEIGSVATPYNRQSMAKSMIDCQRYYQRGHTNLYGYQAAGAGFGGMISFRTEMRAVPTINLSGASIVNNGGVITIQLNTFGFQPNVVTTATGSVAFEVDYAASAEL